MKLVHLIIAVFIALRASSADIGTKDGAVLVSDIGMKDGAARAFGADSRPRGSWSAADVAELRKLEDAGRIAVVPRGSDPIPGSATDRPLLATNTLESVDKARFAEYVAKTGLSEDMKRLAVAQYGLFRVSNTGVARAVLEEKALDTLESAVDEAKKSATALLDRAAARERLWKETGPVLATNEVIVVQAGDNHVGCATCAMLNPSLGAGGVIAIPTIHHPYHFDGLPYKPPTEKWEITQKVRRETATYQWRGQVVTLTNDVLLEGITNRWRFKADWAKE